jgi:hypothetical protein
MSRSSTNDFGRKITPQAASGFAPLALFAAIELVWSYNQVIFLDIHFIVVITIE